MVLFEIIFARKEFSALEMELSNVVYNPYDFATLCYRHLIFLAKNFISSNITRYTPSGCKDLGIRVFGKNSAPLITTCYQQINLSKGIEFLPQTQIL